MQQRSLLPFMHDAARHVQGLPGCSGPGDLAAIRSQAARDILKLHGTRPTPHSAAVAAAGLLYLAEQLDIASVASPPRPCDDAAAMDQLREDALTLADPGIALAQADVTRILDHLDQAVARHGIDLVQSLALEMKCQRLREVMRRADTVVRTDLPQPT